MVLSSDPLISSKSTHTKKKGFEVGKLVELDSEVGTLSWTTGDRQHQLAVVHESDPRSLPLNSFLLLLIVLQ